MNRTILMSIENKLLITVAPWLFKKAKIDE